MRTKEMRKGENSTEEKRRKQQKTVVVYDTLRHRKRIKNMTIIEFIEKMAMIKKKEGDLLIEKTRHHLDRIQIEKEGEQEESRIENEAGVDKIRRKKVKRKGKKRKEKEGKKEKNGKEETKREKNRKR